MKLKIAILAFALAASCGTAQAVTSITSTFQVKIAITANCIFSTGAAADLDFGTQGVLAANVDQSSTIQVQCTNTTPYNIGLNGGSVSGSVTARQMVGPASAKINYILFRDSLRTLNWGNTVGNTLSAVADGTPITHTVYGRVPAQTTPAAGSYAATVTVTVTY